MKKNILTAMAVLFASLFYACKKQTTPTPLDRTTRIEKTEEYYANLRTYKKTKHPITFGWFGNWNPGRATKANSLAGLPDSLDIVSIWSGGEGFEKQNQVYLDDIKNVQNLKGTKVLFTKFLHVIDDRAYPETDEGIKGYAKSIADKVNKYGYDGVDLDYEPDFCGCTVFFKDANFALFVKEIGKYLGPKSGTGKLLLIDGSMTGEIIKANITPELATYFNFFVEQSYDSLTAGAMQARYNAARDSFSPDKWVITLNYESNGITASFNDGTNTYNAMEGYARWNPIEGKKGGVGAYHMQYDYPGIPSYPTYTKAIQIMNPAVK